MYLLTTKCTDAVRLLVDWWKYTNSLIMTARRTYVGFSRVKTINKTIRFCGNGILHRPKLKRLREIFECEELADVLVLFPAVEETLFRPYVHSEWTLSQRLVQLENHFGLVKEVFGVNAHEIFKPKGFALFQFTTNDDEPFTVELFPGYLNEGAIGLRLCDVKGREVYAMSIHLSSEPCRTLYIGALQGPNDRIPDRQQEIVKLTRSNYGLRPKALMVEAMYILAKRLKVEEIYGISNSNRIYPSSFISGVNRSKLLFDADKLWQEYQAELQDSGLYEFPLEPVRKDIKQLKSNKRALYQRRYEWLEKASLYSNQSLDALLNDSIVKRPFYYQEGGLNRQG